MKTLPHRAVSTRKELWMELRDPKLLAKLMAIQGVSQRRLAEDIGWDSHTFLGRLISGKVKTLKPASAVAIADYLGVGVDDLFMARSSRSAGRVVQTTRMRAAA